MARLINARKRHKFELVFFFVCAYGIAWVLWLPLILGKGGLGLIPLQPSRRYAEIGTFGPTIAALITQRVFAGNWRAFRLWSRPRQAVIGISIGSTLLLLACFASAFASTQSGFGLWNWAALLIIPRQFLQNLLGGPLGEEPGWRGFALPRLQKRLPPLVASVVLGLLWANWHLPLLLISFYTGSYWVYVPYLTFCSVIIGFGFNLSSQNTVVAIYLHGLFNLGVGVILNDFMGKATMRQSPSVGVIVDVCFLFVAMLAAISTRGRLGVEAEGRRGGRDAAAAGDSKRFQAKVP